MILPRRGNVCIMGTHVKHEEDLAARCNQICRNYTCGKLLVIFASLQLPGVERLLCKPGCSVIPLLFLRR